MKEIGGQTGRNDPESTNRDNLSSQRQLDSFRKEQFEYLRKKKMFQIENENVQDGKDENILEPYYFEEATKHSKIRLAFGIPIVIISYIFGLYLALGCVKSTHITAVYISIGCTFVSLIAYLFIIYPLYLLLTSCMFTSKSEKCIILQNLLISKESTLILIKRIFLSVNIV
jgi:hypothetical protein